MSTNYVFIIAGDGYLSEMLGILSRIFGSGRTREENLLDDLALRDWYENLPEAEREKVHEYSTMFSTGGEINRIDHTRKGPSTTQQSFLKGVGSSAVHHNDFEIGEKVLLKALEADGDNPTDRHFVYNSLIELYYKQRDDRDDAIENCIKYCKEDIDRIGEFLDEWGDGPGNPEAPRIPAFRRLAIIYERRGEYQEAIAVCERALDFGLSDGTKGGFEGRLERIMKKMEG